MNRYSKLLGPVLVATIAFLATGCSGSASFSVGGEEPSEAAVKLIKTELEPKIGLGELQAECDDVQDPAVGSEFTCRATTSDSQIINIDGKVDREDHINLATTNVLLTAGLPQVESGIAEVIARQNPDAGITGTAVDCGAESIVLDADQSIACDFSDPVDQSAKTVTITFSDLETGEFEVNSLE